MALLAGLIRAPNRYSPFHDAAGARQRRTDVLSTLRAAGDITAAEFDAAMAEPLRETTPRPAGQRRAVLPRRRARRTRPQLPAGGADRRGPVRVHRPRHPLAATGRAQPAGRTGRPRAPLPPPPRHRGRRPAPGLFNRHPAQHGRHQGHDGRPRLHQHAVQPLHPGGAPTRLGVQTVHLPRGVRDDPPRHGPYPADHTHRGRAVQLGVRPRGLDTGQLPEGVPRPGQRPHRARAVAERRHGARRPTRRARTDPRRRAAHGDHVAPARLPVCRPWRRRRQPL